MIIVVLLSFALGASGFWRKKTTTDNSSPKRVSRVLSFNTIEMIMRIVSVLFVIVLGKNLLEVDHNTIRFAPYAIVFAALLATYGWITGAKLTLETHRKQHTLNILMSFRESEMFAVHKARITTNFSSKSPMTKARFKELVSERKKWDYFKSGSNPDQVNFHVLDSVMLVANYYEFIAAGILRDDLDEELMKDTLGGIMVRFYKMVRPYMEGQMKLDGDGNPTTKVYENYRIIFLRWEEGR